MNGWEFHRSREGAAFISTLQCEAGGRQGAPVWASLEVPTSLDFKARFLKQCLISIAAKKGKSGASTCIVIFLCSLLIWLSLNGSGH